MNFEILRNMEPFTEQMFNNIISFQERDHPTWDEKLSFEERIRNIPLHYLVFSNADRNPATHGPTISHYYPLQYEMAKIAALAKKVSEQPVVLDAHARNGFIGSLLAREGVKVVGMQSDQEKPNQIENFHDANRYEMRKGHIGDVDFDVDVVFSSWMPSGENISADINRLKPKLVVFVHTDHVNEQDNARQTGSDRSFGEDLHEDYQLIEEWAVTRPRDLFNEIWPDLTGNLEETRRVKIFASQPFHSIAVDDDELNIQGYSWEDELLMAETARAAKEQMKQQGFPVDF
ncbi:MAG: hypothetical protein R3240_02200 [Gammaproteobacteria bacterium]|nr:hypothetical protein [Gammaproteobacteria bacterium]